MQWTPPSSSSSVNVLYPPLLSPSHYPAAATYSFTADFRAPNLQANQNSSNSLTQPLSTELLDKDSPSPRNFYANAEPTQSFTPPNKSPTFSQVYKYYLFLLCIY